MMAGMSCFHQLEAVPSGGETGSQISTKFFSIIIFTITTSLLILEGSIVVFIQTIQKDITSYTILMHHEILQYVIHCFRVTKRCN